MNEIIDENNSDKKTRPSVCLETGDIIEGRVSWITNFGAFVDLPSNERGLVHISEISNDYVKNVSDYLNVDQKIKVKILSKDSNGKIALSVVKAFDSNKNFNINKKININDKNKILENMIHEYKKISEDKISNLNSRKNITKKRRNKL